MASTIFSSIYSNTILIVQVGGEEAGGSGGAGAVGGAAGGGAGGAGAEAEVAREVIPSFGKYAPLCPILE